MELDSLYSDDHAMLSLTISYPHLKAKFSESKSKRSGKLWGEDKKELFQSNVDIHHINVYFMTYSQYKVNKIGWLVVLGLTAL